MKHVQITGAAGGIGSYLRPALRERYRLRLTDVGEVSGLAEGEQGGDFVLVEEGGGEPRAER